MNTAPLAVTLGDPAGIGPEIVAKAWLALRDCGPKFLVVGDAKSVAAATSGEPGIVRTISTPDEALGAFPTSLPVLDIPLPAAAVLGRPDPASAASVIRWIETAVDLTLTGKVRGVVTAPIAKAPLYEAGFKFPGHTEFLGELTASAPFEGVRGPIMMLTAADLRVTLVTVHTPLARVAGQLSIDGIVHAAQVTAQALRRDFGIAAPRLAVAGLNPHAGESGGIGGEEIEIVAPAVAVLRNLGIDARGPFPSDSLFHAEARARYDGVICLYHDQALIPVKMLDFWGGVNITLGLPIVRTSPDHGTAFDIAGQGIARPDSLIAALRAADEIALRRGA